MGSRSESRRRLLTGTVFVAIIVAAVVLAMVTYRAAFQLESLRAQALFQATLGLADEKVDRVDRAIVESDDAILALGEGGRADEVPRRFGALSRATPTVAHVLVLDASAGRSVVGFASRNPGPLDDAFRLLLLRRVLPDLDLSTLPMSQIKHLHRAYDGTFLLLTYFRAQHLRGDGTYDERLVVLHHDVDAVRRELLEQVVPEPRAASARVNVVDDEGRIIFGQPLGKSDLVVQKRFPTTLYAWRLQVAPTSSEGLAEKARRRRFLEMSLLAMSAVVVVAGAIVLLLATAQERRLNALRSEFVANVSHELKTPLAIVRMYGELLASGRVPTEEKKQQYLNTIVRESERLSALIENVLDFARVERGKKVAYEFADAELGALVGKAVEACRYRADTEGMRLELDAEPEVFARVDERAVQLAVINLVENAVKYAPASEVVSVSVGRERGAAVVRVRDRGPGIPPEDRERVFERFYRGKQPDGRQVRGSGIGLSLVASVMEAHQGDVRVESGEDGVGSVFVLTFPFEGPPPSSVRR